MKVCYEESLKAKIMQHLGLLKGHVVLRSDLEVLGSYRQISRGLEVLQKEGLLVKIGRGVYAKSYRSQYVDKPVIEGGFATACQEALNRLGVKWKLGSAAEAYNAGVTTQVPARLVVKLKTRFRRKLAYGKQTMVIEKRAYGR